MGSFLRVGFILGCMALLGSCSTSSRVGTSLPLDSSIRKPAGTPSRGVAVRELGQGYSPRVVYMAETKISRYINQDIGIAYFGMPIRFSSRQMFLAAASELDAWNSPNGKSPITVADNGSPLPLTYRATSPHFRHKGWICRNLDVTFSFPNKDQRKKSFTACRVTLTTNLFELNELITPTSAIDPSEMTSLYQAIEIPFFIVERRCYSLLGGRSISLTTMTSSLTDPYSQIHFFYGKNKLGYLSFAKTIYDGVDGSENPNQIIMTNVDLPDSTVEGEERAIRFARVTMNSQKPIPDLVELSEDGVSFETFKNCQ